ncbi:hypothetical protein RF11_02049 [Thelohanellus kitauei]|uniref:Uncharacterized protein n=1 Tax=Thelohanellus kitauei TaxID=669202 RepID=A0A0C2JB39_THEKT|nr:hypothetical protein RF11_02049 [Thelohanellus kitauei]
MNRAINHSYYRRFEMAVSNFKFPFYEVKYTAPGFDDWSGTYCSKYTKTCRVLTKVTFNHITEEREFFLNDEYHPDVGIHLFHTEVWEEPPNVHSVFSVRINQ